MDNVCLYITVESSKVSSLAREGLGGLAAPGEFWAPEVLTVHINSIEYS